MGRKRLSHEVERDLQITTELYLKGHSTRFIAMKIGERVNANLDEGQKLYTTTHKTVGLDIRRLIKQWSEERIHDISSQKMVALEKLDRLEETYWAAWEKSVENHVKKTNKVRGKAGASNPDYQEITDIAIIEYGEPRYLQGVERCIDKRCKLLGLDAPVKTEIQDNSFINFLMNTA